MIRRIFLSLILVTLLLFAQQVAMQHPYVHIADNQQNSSENKQVPKHTEVCGKCLSLADIQNIVSSTAQTLNIAAGQFALTTTVSRSFTAAQFFSYHSRAPPTLT